MHYYFDLKNGVTSRDHGGLELPSDADAIAKAKIIAEEVAAESARHPSRHVSVVREDGSEVTRVPIVAVRKKA
jgi:hypothetical protein